MTNQRLFNALVFILMCFIISETFAQSKKATISGFVYDSSNGEAMIGVNVYIKNAGIGGSTNNSGYFVINSAPIGKQTLQFSSVGYKTISVDVDVSSDQHKQLRVELTPKSVNINEVTISSDKEKLADKLFAKPASKIEMSGSQVNAIPKVIEADLLRALQTMPGITAISDFSSELYVRGGTPDQNLYLIDGADVYNPDHAFGIFSTFNTNAIKKVEVSKGGFGAEYGGRLSSVLDVTNLDGNRNKFEGIFNLSLLSGSTTLQIPIGSIGSISGSFRRTYIDQTYAKWSKDIPDYYFYDGNLKGFFDLSEQDKLSLSFFKSSDNLKYKQDKDAPESFGFFYDWGNTTGSLNWKHIFNQNIFSSFWVTGSSFSSNFKFDKILNLSEKNELSDYSFKGLIEYYATNELTFKLGAEHKILRFLYDEEWEQGRVDIEQRDHLTTAYLNAGWSPTILWDFEAGARLNYFKADISSTNIEPRLAIKYRLSETSSIKFASGIYHQYLDRVPRLFFSSIWCSADKYIKPSSSYHYILSYQKQLGDLLQLEVETYYKNYKNLYSYNQNLNAMVTPGYFDASGNPVYNNTKGIFTRGDGNSLGFEVLLRKDVGAITGWVSYSLARTKNTYDGINQGNEYAPRHDRASVVNFILNSDISDLFSGNWNGEPTPKSSKWLLGLNFIYASGQPITAPASAYQVSTVPDGNDNTIPGENIPGYKLYPGSIDSYRLPAYSRMDLSITYEKDYGSWTLSPYLQIFNIGSRKNIWFIQYQSEFKNNSIIQTVKKVNMLPILPSIGVTVKF